MRKLNLTSYVPKPFSGPQKNNQGVPKRKQRLTHTLGSLKRRRAEQPTPPFIPRTEIQQRMTGTQMEGAFIGPIELPSLEALVNLLDLRKPVNWQEIMGENRVLCIGDVHPSLTTKLKIFADALNNLPEITHVAFEFPTQNQVVLDVYCNQVEQLGDPESPQMEVIRQPVRELLYFQLRHRPPEHKAAFVSSFFFAVDQGKKIITLDANDSETKNVTQRNLDWLRPIVFNLIDPYAKILVFAGRAHFGPEPQTFNEVLKRDDNISSSLANFCGSDIHFPELETFEDRLYQAIRRRGLEEETFMIDMNETRFQPFGSFIIHTPSFTPPRR